MKKAALYGLLGGTLAFGATAAYSLKQQKELISSHLQQLQFAQDAYKRKEVSIIYIIIIL